MILWYWIALTPPLSIIGLIIAVYFDSGNPFDLDPDDETHDLGGES